MKRIIAPLLLLTLLLTACGDAPRASEETPWEPFAYTLSVEEGYCEETDAQDGTPLCSCRYDLPTLTVEDEGALSPAQRASLAQFDIAMEEILSGSILLYESLCETALADYEYRSAVSLAWEGAYRDEMRCTAYTTPYAVSLDFAGYTNSGAPYPAEGNVCYLFDLEAAELVEVEDIADGDALRAALAGEILRQIEEGGLAAQYYDDYEATVRAQSEVQIFFAEDALTVYFPDYTLGPHAAGYPSFRVESAVYRDTLNERGLRLLGLA